MSGRRQSSLSCSRIARRRHRSTPPSVHEHRQVMCYQQVDADYPPMESARSFESPLVMASRPTASRGSLHMDGTSVNVEPERDKVSRCREVSLRLL
ncbi:hypothetical protein CesoFtcFv8_005888 [Champsocephalus esox]|uniref:Uncharacterized protein n=1 Tax=Champsocephalus esox TaxID=159716 RepID=A0AAN8CIP6_9TELE|nr:hypothetical protein CesoFtcFv8_005888 [Champsocephalus esox]